MPVTSRQRVPWNPQAICDDVLHRYAEATDPPPILLSGEQDIVMALTRGYDWVDGVWVEGHNGMIGLLWPMKLGRGDQA